MVVEIIGGGLAGSEAAWQASQYGVKVKLYEMRPFKFSDAHKSDKLGELVCSNSLRSEDPLSASGVLKRELERAGSLIMMSARATAVPAGSALAVDRELFSDYITSTIRETPNIEVTRKEVDAIPEGLCIIATGPLTSHAMISAIGSLIERRYLYFYDAIAPIVSADSIDFSKVFYGSRYGKGGSDYVNCPMNEEQYNRFYDALLRADMVKARKFEDIRVFEGCMPLEVMAARGRDTLRYGPIKPVGLREPTSGKRPFAVVQLRPENRERSAYNLVGFQCRLKWPEQRKVFRLIPGLERAEFLRYGSIHRNTFIKSPAFINRDLSFKARKSAFIAGQLSGVEGYLESTAMGLVAGINAARMFLELPCMDVPATTAHGSLIRYITENESEDFQPSNINFGLFPPLEQEISDKKVRRKMISERALNEWKSYLARIRHRDIQKRAPQ